LYQEPLAWDAVLFANRNLLRNTQLSLADMYHYAGGLLDTYWVSFGYGALTAPAVFYSLINWLLVVSLVGVGIWIFQNSKRRPLPVQLLSVVLLIVWNGLLFVSLLQWMRLLQETNQGRLLFPGIGAVAVLIVVGFSALLSGRRNWLGLGFVSLLGVLAVLAPFMLIKPAYAQPTSVLMVSDIPNPVNVTFGDHIELLGYALSETAVSPGDSLAVDLYWNTDAVLSENYAVSLHVLDPSGEVASRLNVLPYNGRYATPVWRPDFPFKDTYTMPPINEGAIPGRGHLIVSLYPWGAHQEPLPVVVDDIPIGAIHTIAPLKIASGVTAVYDDMASKTDIIFGEKIKLLGFDAPGNLVPAQTYPITLFWEALQPDGVDYTVFVHLVDSQGQVVAQADSPPQNNRFPTSIWAKNEQIVDVHTLVLPEDLASGFYDLFVGLYDPNTGQRLTAVASDGTPSPENSFLLTTKSTE
ncbi:MAG: hypothetical protein IAF02_10320, partial [Anaerolineae bacterium]|nr:hypothetical protein [Anaerolineae bacterium]